MFTMETKQVIVMRKDLNMRKGKMCAQASHASMKVILDLMTKYVNIKEVTDRDSTLEPTVYNYNLMVTEGSYLQDWLGGSFTKIVVGVDSEQKLLALLAKAAHDMIPCSLITDAGKTEFNGPTNTCIAIGPYLSDKIDEITGHLKLL